MISHAAIDDHATTISDDLKLQWDAQNEKFVDDSDADSWLRREPYGVPAYENACLRNFLASASWAC